MVDHSIPHINCLLVEIQHFFLQFNISFMDPDVRGYTSLPSQALGGGDENDVLRGEKTDIQDQNETLSTGFERVSLF